VQRGSDAARVREAEAAARAARAALDDGIARLRADLADALFHVQDAGRTEALYRDALLPRAQETLDLALRSYEGGDASLLDLVDALAGLLEIRLGALRATRDLLEGQVHVRALQGGPIR
jgi:outer membrane protein TolC